MSAAPPPRRTYAPPDDVAIWADDFRERVQIPESERFLDYDDYLAQCWLWVGAVRADGQAFIRVAGRYEPVQRFAYQLWVGEVPSGLFARPTACQTKLCVCPHHLSLVPRGARSRKLTDQQRRDIRWLYHNEHGGTSARKLADLFGVSEQYVYELIRRRDG